MRGVTAGGWQVSSEAETGEDVGEEHATRDGRLSPVGGLDREHGMGIDDRGRVCDAHLPLKVLRETGWPEWTKGTIAWDGTVSGLKELCV